MERSASSAMLSYVGWGKARSAVPTRSVVAAALLDAVELLTHDEGQVILLSNNKGKTISHEER